MDNFLTVLYFKLYDTKKEAEAMQKENGVVADLHFQIAMAKNELLKELIIEYLAYIKNTNL